MRHDSIMSYNLIHRGIFYSREGVQWDIRILRDQYWEEEEIGMLSFSGEEPLVIEWDEKSKEEVICGSSATLKLISPEDGTYLELYSVAVGEYRLEVLKNGVLYWSGTLDPEFYEEPYSWEKDYEVTLTFSDFGILDRQKYVLSGMKTLREILDYSLGRSGICFSRVDETMISTSLSGGSGMSLSELTVRSDNFYDEDGEPCSLKEVLEGVFQPLALRMIQRGGVVWVYDLNGLYVRGSLKKVEWMSDDQVLGVDSVYNDAKVTWSTYAQSGVLNKRECYVDETDVNVIVLNNLNGAVYGESRVYSYHYSRELADWADTTDSGFSLWTSELGKNAELKANNTRFFKIVAQEDGQDLEGIAIWWPSCMGSRQYYNGGSSTNVQILLHGAGWGWDRRAGAGPVLWKSQDVWLPPVGRSEALCLRIALNLLMDCRMNPFETATNVTDLLAEKDWYDEWQKLGNFVYIPVTLKFQPEGSNDIYCWTNLDVVDRAVSRPVQALGETMGRWELYNQNQDNSPFTYGYLCWYNSDDRNEKCGVLGWHKNRSAINPHTSRLTTSLNKAADGQYVPYPTYGGRGGKLWLEVRYLGWVVAKGGASLSSPGSTGLWDGGKTLWCLMQLPEIEIQNARQYDTEINTDDVEYKGELNSAAKEDIEIETICGTVKGGIPTARGAYFRSSNLAQIETLTRANRTAQVEELLIGTLYSQFGQRKAKLEGTTTLPDKNLCLYREATLVGTRFLLTGAIENMQDDTCESILVELSQDVYDREH